MVRRRIIVPKLSLRACGPRNLMKAECSNGLFPIHGTNLFVFRSSVIATIVLSTLLAQKPYSLWVPK
jgi:hypothetical protein